VLAPLRIEVQPRQSAHYKSIEDLVWDNVPPFAILTGVNGSGKTHLLELLAYKITGTTHPQNVDLNKIDVSVTPESFGPESVLYLPSAWDMQSAPALGVAQLTQIKEHLYQQLQPQQVQNQLGGRARRARLSQILGKDLSQFTREAFIKALPNDYVFMLEDEDIVGGLAHVLMAHKVRMADEALRGTKLEDLEAKLGRAPWDLVNEALSAAEFAYRVVSPVETNLDDTYQFKLRDPIRRLDIVPAELSSGEKAILRTLLWLFRARHRGQFAKLYLLDEPDAHLHPSMTQQFLNVLKDVLVDRHNIRIIMATHSPSTVAMAPEGSVFEMYKTQPRIQPSPSNAHSVGLLTAGLVVVARGTRFVFVEDQDDVEFYKVVWDAVTYTAGDTTVGLLNRTPSLVFLAASVGKRSNRNTSGGSSVVRQWIAKFDQPPLEEIFRGVIDLDNGNTASPRVAVLSRYSFENYLVDPVLIYGLLLEAGRAPAIQAVKIEKGDEHLIRELGQAQLQSVVDIVCAQIAPSLPNHLAQKQALKSVEFTNGTTVKYPTWTLEAKGHELLPLCQSVFSGSTNLITPPNLRRMFQRVRLVPRELLQILKDLQS
jgi:predicted ATPase